MGAVAGVIFDRDWRRTSLAVAPAIAVVVFIGTMEGSHPSKCVGYAVEEFIVIGEGCCCI
jgi:hypothetical protein